MDFRVPWTNSAPISIIEAMVFQSVTGALMPSYRIYFLDEKRDIRGRQDFDAGNDVDAIRIARTLLSACTDVCQSFDLWQGIRHVRTRKNHRSMTFDALAEEQQAIVIETEEMLSRSQWQVSKSQLLIKRLDAAQRARRSISS